MQQTKLGITAFLMLLSATVLGQKLDRSKKELTKDSGTARTSKSTSSGNDDESDDDDSPWIEFIVDGLGYVVYGLVGDYSEEEHLDNNLTPYPFYTTELGNYEPFDSVAKNNFRVDLENHFLYNSNDLYGNHMKAKIHPFQYFYVQADFRQLIEQPLDGGHDQLSLFHFNFCYDRIRFEQFNLGWNLGASYVGNEVKKAGFCYGLSADYFMTNRLSFGASAKWSRINQQPVNTYEFQGKFHRRNYFFALGFQHLKIATPTFNFLSLGGGIYF